MIQIAIVEDKLRDYKLLNECLEKYEEEENEQFSVVYFKDAIDFVSDYHYTFDLIFMDIAMPDLDGIKAAEKIRKKDNNVELVFVTSMAQYAIQGYDVSARFFIVKPIVYEEFKDKMERIVSIIKKKRSDKFLILSRPREKVKVFCKDIRYIEVFQHDVVFHTSDEEIHVRSTLSEVEKKLDEPNFIRINSCYIVNLDFVSKVKESAVFIDDVSLPVSYAKKKAFMRAFADYVSSGKI